MEFKVTRKTFTDESTIGDMTVIDDPAIADTFLCHTLEDTVREPGVKVPGETAIPPGRYQIVIDMSDRFKKLMPHILNVPGFGGIRVHSGNTAMDTEGCLIVGMVIADDSVSRSREAYALFYAKLEEGLKQGKVYITIG